MLYSVLFDGNVSMDSYLSVSESYSEASITPFSGRLGAHDRGISVSLKCESRRVVHLSRLPDDLILLSRFLYGKNNYSIKREMVV